MRAAKHAAKEKRFTRTGGAWSSIAAPSSTIKPKGGVLLLIGGETSSMASSGTADSTGKSLSSTPSKSTVTTDIFLRTGEYQLRLYTRGAIEYLTRSSKTALTSKSLDDNKKAMFANRSQKFTRIGMSSFGESSILASISVSF